MKRESRDWRGFLPIIPIYLVKSGLIKAFRFEKPLTSIEVDGEDNDRIRQFMKELENFFFIGRTYFEPDSQELGFSRLIFISRFKNLLDLKLLKRSDITNRTQIWRIGWEVSISLDLKNLENRKKRRKWKKSKNLFKKLLSQILGIFHSFKISSN